MTALAIQPVVFSFHETHDVRIQMIEGEPWFFAVDVCESLGLKDTNKALLGLDDDEKREHEHYSGSGRKPILISEPGLYGLILRSRKPEAKAFKRWLKHEVLPTIRKTGSYEKKPPAEPLTHKDMCNLRHLVWMMTSSMKFESSWNAGIWYALRSATGRPSPQPFSVDDLPVLGEECRRILRITAAFNSAVYDFEKSVIRKVVRQRQPLESLLDLMEKRLAEIHQQESAGLLILDKLSEHGVNCLIHRQ